ncbi:MAG: hypothetical protein IKW20_09100 [Bacteroidales bacterium]|nr:hypothetical protein [Bacteroidales bacterium]
MYRLFTYLIFSLFAISAMAQEPDSLTFKKGKVVPMDGAFIQQLQERDSVLIADQLCYGFELKGVEEGTQFALPQWQNDEKGGVMVVSSWQVDTVKMTKPKKGMPRLLDIKAGLVITSFDEGTYELPAITVGRLSKDGVVDTLVFDPIRLEVKTMPLDTATFQPHDIKGQIRYPVTLAEILPWFLLSLVVALLVAGAVYLIIKYRRKHDPMYIKSDPAHIVALRKLDQYRGNKMWAADKQKVFYSGVTDALREYISSRYGISAMEMTTAEIFKEMKSTDAPEALQMEMKELFERADFVKFAKYIASEEDNASVLPVAVRFVTETYQTEIAMSGEDASNNGGTN